MTLAERILASIIMALTTEPTAEELRALIPLDSAGPPEAK